jgi:hypothetical protein
MPAFGMDTRKYEDLAAVFGAENLHDVLHNICAPNILMTQNGAGSCTGSVFPTSLLTETMSDISLSGCSKSLKDAWMLTTAALPGVNDFGSAPAVALPRANRSQTDKYRSGRPRTAN